MTRVDFAELPWEEVGPGLRQKVADGARLVEHGREFIEEDWCTRAHVGYLISGELYLEYRDRDDVLLRAGDGIRIAGGEDWAHKGHCHEDSPALMFLVD